MSCSRKNKYFSVRQNLGHRVVRLVRGERSFRLCEKNVNRAHKYVLCTNIIVAVNVYLSPDGHATTFNIVIVLLFFYCARNNRVGRPIGRRPCTICQELEKNFTTGKSLREKLIQ